MIEELNIRYENKGDYILPYITIKVEKELNIGVWANRHRCYLKQHHRIRYYNLLTSENLYPYLADIEKQAKNMFQRIVKSLADKKITEKMKAESPIEWVQKMNNIRNRATEIVNNEVIFK